MTGSPPEEDKTLEQGRAALVEAAAIKAEALYARLGEITGMSREEPGTAEVSVIQRRADKLSRFVGRYSHLLGRGNGDTPEEESEEPKEVKLSPKSWEVVVEAVDSVIMHDGRIENDDGSSPITALMEENHWERRDWDLAKPAVEKLGVLSLNRKGARHTPYESISLEMENIIAIERLIAEGKLPDYLLEPLQDIKIHKAQEAVEEVTEATGDEIEATGPDEAEPTLDELEGIESSKER